MHGSCVHRVLLPEYTDSKVAGLAALAASDQQAQPGEGLSPQVKMRERMQEH